MTTDMRAADGVSIDRRAFLAGAAATLAASCARAQTPAVRLRKLNCFEIRVSDVERSVAFYQDLFGMPVQARAADRVCLRVGDGPQFMAVRGLETGEMPAITHLGYSVEDYDPERLLGALRGMGFERIDAPPPAAPGIDHAMKTWTRTRSGTPELYFSDARGLVVQLSDPAYCGGTGAAGAVCAEPEPALPGLMALHDLNHFTVFVNDGAEANRFYQDAFGLPIQTYQGPGAPVTGIGDGYQFVMYAGPGGRPDVPANIHHGCFSMHGFDVERVQALLSGYGIEARGAAAARPLVHYLSLRMPERGGAEGGTPELYFTDPDGILLQLQDLSYCGGGGYLGDVCRGA